MRKWCLWIVMVMGVALIVGCAGGQSSPPPAGDPLPVLDRILARGALRVTVNTQEDNLASLAIYKKAHFHTTGESYPIYEYDLRR